MFSPLTFFFYIIVLFKIHIILLLIFGEVHIFPLLTTLLKNLAWDLTPKSHVKFCTECCWKLIWIKTQLYQYWQSPTRKFYTPQMNSKYRFWSVLKHFTQFFYFYTWNLMWDLTWDFTWDFPLLAVKIQRPERYRLAIQGLVTHDMTKFNFTYLPTNWTLTTPFWHSNWNSSTIPTSRTTHLSSAWKHTPLGPSKAIAHNDEDDDESSPRSQSPPIEPHSTPSSSRTGTSITNTRIVDDDVSPSLLSLLIYTTPGCTLTLSVCTSKTEENVSLLHVISYFRPCHYAGALF